MKVAILLWAVCFAPAFSLAALGESDVQTSATQPDTAKKTRAEILEGKTTQLAVSILGVGSGAQNAGIQASYLINNSMAVVFEGTNGSHSEGEVFNLGSNTQADARSYGIHLRHYLKDTLYYRVGFDYRKVELRYTEIILASPSLDSAKVNGESTVASVGFGSQWQWDYFMLGIEWMAASVPLSSRVISRSVHAQIDPLKTEKAVDAGLNRYLKGITYTGLRLFLGASF